MLAIERDNPSLKGVLPKDYAHPRLDKQRLGQLIDLIGNIGLGDRENRSRDILGRVYEYFLSQFASAEGKKGGQFYTPHCVVRLLVEMLAPYKGRVYEIITQSLIQFDFAFLPRTQKGANHIKRVHLKPKGCNVKRYEGGIERLCIQGFTPVVTEGFYAFSTTREAA